MEKAHRALNRRPARVRILSSLASVIVFAALCSDLSCSFFVARPELSAQVLEYGEVEGPPRQALVSFGITNAGNADAAAVVLSYAYHSSQRDYYRTVEVGSVPAGFTRYCTDAFDFLDSSETRSGSVTDVAVGYE